jgi:hypothetical protein
VVQNAWIWWLAPVPGTVVKTVTIPADHLLHLDFVIPEQIPAGTVAHLELFCFPPRQKATYTLDATLEKIWTLCKDSSVTIDGFLEMRRQDIELEEKKCLISLC